MDLAKASLTALTECISTSCALMMILKSDEIRASVVKCSVCFMLVYLYLPTNQEIIMLLQTQARKRIKKTCCTVE